MLSADEAGQEVLNERSSDYALAGKDRLVWTFQTSAALVALSPSCRCPAHIGCWLRKSIGGSECTTVDLRSGRRLLSSDVLLKPGAVRRLAGGREANSSYSLAFSQCAPDRARCQSTCFFFLAVSNWTDPTGTVAEVRTYRMRHAAVRVERPSRASQSSSCPLVGFLACAQKHTTCAHSLAYARACTPPCEAVFARIRRTVEKCAVPASSSHWHAPVVDSRVEAADLYDAVKQFARPSRSLVPPRFGVSTEQGGVRSRLRRLSYRAPSTQLCAPRARLAQCVVYTCTCFYLGFTACRCNARPWPATSRFNEEAKLDFEHYTVLCTSR